MPEAPVLIVGAGPTGLTMACELTRHGVPCRIIDKKAKRSQTSKALAVFPRTLEVFETMGVVDRVLDAGLAIFEAIFHQGAKEMARVDFSSLASPYPFVISLPQSETERILSEHLATLGVPVEREVELTGLIQTDTAVRATVRFADGRADTIEAPWVVGCDGAHSATRHALGMEFEGAPYDESFVLADVRAESSLSRNALHLFLSDDGVLGVIPLGEDRVRVIANIAPGTRTQNLDDPTIEEIQQYADRRGPGDLRVSDPVWTSRFHISHRKVAQLRKLRVFLAGDAAHIHSPAGGQGMNTGIQDALNLAWKLALVLKGAAPPTLLASYHLERDPVAKSVLNLTDRITRIATVRNSLVQTARNLMLPMIASSGFVSEKIADQLAELSINYRRSPIVESHGGGAVRAGDRAPDGELRDADGRARRLFELFRDRNHVLLVFAGGGAHREAASAITATACGDQAAHITVHRIDRGRRAATAGSLRDISGAVHSAYDLLDGGLILVRPDGYVGYRSDDFSPAKLRAGLARNFSTTETKHD